MAKDVVIPKQMEETYKQFHFAPAVRDGDRLFCSGQIGSGPGGAPLEDPLEDPEAQFAQAFENVKTVLEAVGATLDDVVDITTYHVGFGEHVAKFMAVKDRYISEPYPTWTAIGVSELAFGALVEIQIVASLRS